MALDRFLNLLPDPFIPVLSDLMPGEGLRRGNEGEGREGRAWIWKYVWGGELLN